MDRDGEPSGQVMTKLIGMGFEISAVTKAVKEVGPSLQDAVEYLLNDSDRNRKDTSSSSRGSTRDFNAVGKRTLASSYKGQTRQPSILELLQPNRRSKRSRMDISTDVPVSRSKVLHGPLEKHEKPFSAVACNLKTVPESFPVDYPQELGIESEWEKKANSLLKKHFGYSSVKPFQREVLAAWLAHQDCLVLAATGSGKSLCFQIPALLTGKIVVVISPLISLMHDQCLKLAKHGVSACFLGSGQPDSSVEQKAMRGMYSIIYVCPETVLRLIIPLQQLAENRGIALFAIDEVHCVSKWGHDFRPDYRKLSVLRENFSARNLNFLRYDIPLMALTATATTHVRQDIIESLCMSKETKIVLTSFFRSNLRFSVKHSRTSSSASYKKDFSELIDVYARNKKSGRNREIGTLGNLVDMCDHYSSSASSESEADGLSEDDEVASGKDNEPSASKGKQLSVEYLENEADVFQSVDDWDVACGEFCGESLSQDCYTPGSTETPGTPLKEEERLRLLHKPLEQGPTIIYVPTRKETLRIAKFLCQFGVKAASYNAGLPKARLRQVHKEFHESTLEVVVATIAFGMGIDKPNVRRIIHYGWPQSLEAYYQEAGRAGRDGKLADCTLYANLSRMPTLLPNKRSEDQTKQAYKMLADCFRYGMNTSSCRAKILVEYFGEDFCYGKCLVCDACVTGPPEMQNVKEEANVLMQVIAAHYGQSISGQGSYDEITWSDINQRRLAGRPNLRLFVSKIREQCQKYLASDVLWWRGLARIMEDKGYIREGDNKTHVQVKFPEPTQRGLQFLQSKRDEAFNVYPEADMQLAAVKNNKPYSSFSEWGKGWADPEIRRQRLDRGRANRKPRKRKPRPDLKTVRGRLAVKLAVHKK